MKETSAIFDHSKKGHLEAAFAPNVLRASLDAKAPVLIGPFSRGGRSRVGTEGADHDFRPWGKLTPFGIFLPDTKDLSFSLHRLEGDERLHRGSAGAVVGQKQAEHPKVDTLLLDLDNGPENQSRWSQFIYRLVLFAQATQLKVVLAYYTLLTTASMAWFKGAEVWVTLLGVVLL